MIGPKYLLSAQSKNHKLCYRNVIKEPYTTNYRSLQKLVQRLHLQLFHKAFLNLLAHDLWPSSK